MKREVLINRFVESFLIIGLTCVYLFPIMIILNFGVGFLRTILLLIFIASYYCVTYNGTRETIKEIKYQYRK